jgi:hypothetical protein
VSLRARDDDFDGERDLRSMRDAVISATVKYRPGAGSAATLDAVDEALAQLYIAGALTGTHKRVKKLWIKAARCELVDERRSAYCRRREPFAVEVHMQALAVSVSGDLGESSDERREWWRIREVIRALHGDQRRWAEAWFKEVSGRLKPSAQPRGLAEKLGWSQAKTEKVAGKARETMAAFVNARASGALCTQQGSLLDTFIATSDTAQQPVDRDHERFERALCHVAGCEDCSAAWHARRRPLRERSAPAVMFPLDILGSAANALAGKLAGVLAGAQHATLSVLQRVGIGEGPVVVATSLSAKTAAACVSIACAATAGVELTVVLAPTTPNPAQHQREQAAGKAPRPMQPASTQAAPLTSPPAPAAPSSPTGAPSARRTTTSSATPRTSTSRVTPGDLPLASSTRSPTPTPAPTARFDGSSATATRPATSTSTPTCFPGDLGC